MPIPQWDNFTAEQKNLFRIWLKSVSQAATASQELIKSLNPQDEVIQDEAIITFNEMLLDENFDTHVAELPCDNICAFQAEICRAACRAFRSSGQQQCINGCDESFNRCQENC